MAQITRRLGREVRGDPRLVSPVSEQRGSHQATSPALSAEENKAEENQSFGVYLQVGCGQSVKRAAAKQEASKATGPASEGPAHTCTAPSQEDTLEGHPSAQLLQKTSAQRGRGRRAVTHGPLANPRVRPAPGEGARRARPRRHRGCEAASLARLPPPGSLPR